MSPVGLVLLTAAWGQATTPENAEAIVVRDLGVGFPTRSEIPNLPPRPGELRQHPFIGRGDTWMPFQVTLENRGPAVEGVLELSDGISVGGMSPLVYRKRVSLPARARKRISFPVLHRTAQASHVLTFEDDRGGILRLGGETRLEILPPNSVGLTSTLVVIATESRGSFSHFIRGSRADALAQDRFMVPVAPEDLPPFAIEYHGVDALVLDDIPLDALSADQQDAIRQFVARGGVLVVSLLRNAERIRDARLAELLPGKPDGMSNQNDVSALTRATGFPCALRPTLALTTFRPVAGAEGWEGAPWTIGHRRFEKGFVIVCGFPLSAAFLESWPGASRFLQVLTEVQPSAWLPPPGGVDPIPLRHQFAVALKESMVRTLPPFRTILWLLVGYGVLISLLPYVVFRRLNRVEWSWGGVLVIGLAGSGVIYGVGQKYLQSDSVAYRVGVIEGGSEGGCQLRHNFWSVFTARADRLELSFEDPLAVPHPLGAELSLRGASSRDAMTVGYDEVRLQDFRTFSQDSSLFETTDRSVLPAPLGFAVPEGAGEVRIRHGSAFPIRHAWVVGKDEAGESGDFRGEETPVPMANTTFSVIEAKLHAGGDRLLEKAAGVLLRTARSQSESSGKRYLVYLYDGAPSLKNRTLPERALDFGIAELRDEHPPLQPARWQIRRLGATPQDPYDSALYTDEGIQFSMVLRDVPPDCRVRDIRFISGSGLHPELYDLRLRGWRRINRDEIGAEDLVHLSPLGSAFALLRMREELSGGDVRARWSGYRISPPEAVSRIERKGP